MRSRIFGFKNYCISELLLVFVSVIAVQTDLTNKQLLLKEDILFQQCSINVQTFILNRIRKGIGSKIFRSHNYCISELL